jgi:PAS domain S-box-containing protein
VERVLGYPMNYLQGRNVFELVHPADREPALQAFEGSLSKPGVTFRGELRLRHSDGQWRTVEFVGRNLFHEPAVQGVVINSRDITDRAAASH